MIVHLKEKGINVEVPDDMPDDQIQLLSKMDFPTKTEELAKEHGGISQYQPNFYEKYIKTTAEELGVVDIPLVQDRTPAAHAFVPKAVEHFTFGVIDFDEEEGIFAEAIEEHPIAAMAGEITGEVGSLMATSGALAATKLPKLAAAAGQLGAKAVPAAPRFLPKMIFAGATFGTKSMISSISEQFKNNEADLEELSMNVIKDTGFGAAIGLLGGIATVPKAIAAAGGFGFISAKLEGGDNTEALINGAVWMTFELLASKGRSKKLNEAAVKYLSQSFGDYARARNPNLTPKQATQMGAQFVNAQAQKHGGIDKIIGSKEEMLKYLEGLNSQVRKAIVPKPKAKAKKKAAQVKGKTTKKAAKAKKPPKEKQLAKIEEEGLASADYALTPEEKIPVKGIKTVGHKERIKKAKKLKQDQLEIESAIEAKKGVEQLVRDRRIAINLANYETNLFIHEINKDLTKPQREVIPFIIEKTKVPAELKRKDLEKIHAEQFDELKPVAEKIEKHLDGVWEKYKKAMGDMSVKDIENYITHIWEVPKKQKSEITNWFTTKNKFAKQRFIETYAAGIKKGLKPKTLDVSEILRIHDHATNKAIINKKFVDSLKKISDSGTPLIARADKAPENWVLYTHPALKQTLIIPGEITRGEKVSSEMVSLLNEMGVAIGSRLYPKSFAGLYMPTKKEIRLQRFFETRTLTHEIGHHIDLSLGLGKEFLNAHKDELYAINKHRIDKLSKNPGKYGKDYAESTEEQIAEFFAVLFTDPNQAIEKAPNATMDALMILQEDGVLSKLIDFNFETRAKKLLEEQANKIVSLPIKVHPDLKKPLDVVFGERFNHPAIEVYESLNGILKKSSLSFSLFHHLALTETGIPLLGARKTAQLVFNPKAIYNALVNDDIVSYTNTPLVKHWIKRGLQLGATADIPVQKIQEKLNKLADASRGIIGAAQVTKVLATFNEKWDKALWEYLHDTLKLYGAEAQMAKIDPAIEGAERFAMEQEIAQFVNDTFGGQNWDMLMVDPKTLQMMTWTLLSADWTTSTIRQALSPTGLGAVNEESKKMRKNLGRKFWAKAGLYFGVGVNMLNALNRKMDVEQNPQFYEGEDFDSFMDYTMFNNSVGHGTHLFMGRYSDGTERYLRWGKQFRELAEFFFDKTGFSPLTAAKKKLGGKAAPVPQLVSQIATGHSLSGFRNKDIAGKEGWEQSWGIFKTLVKSPFPFSTRSLMDKNKEFKLTDIAMPSSKGMSKFKTIDLFKKAIERGDERLFFETWEAAARNNLSAFSLYTAAITTVKAEGTREINSEIKTLEAAQAAFNKAETGIEKKIIGRKMKRLKKENKEKQLGNKLLEKALKEIEKARLQGKI